MARMVSRGNEAHPEKRVKRDLKELGSKAPEDQQDHLVRTTTTQFCFTRAINLDFLPPQAFQGREDPAAKVLRADLGIQDLPGGPESPDPLVLLDLPATVTRTRVWATMLEVPEVGSVAGC